MSVTQSLGSWSVCCSCSVWGPCSTTHVCNSRWIQDWESVDRGALGLSSGRCPGQTTSTLGLRLCIWAFPDLYFFLRASAMAGGTSRWSWKAFLFPLQIATCVADSSSSVGLYWGMSQNPGLFIFHIVCTLISALHPRDFLRKHQFGLLTIWLQFRFSSLYSFLS